MSVLINLAARHSGACSPSCMGLWGVVWHTGTSQWLQSSLAQVGLKDSGGASFPVSRAVRETVAPHFVGWGGDLE